jgi:hypothetical protein
VGLGFNIANAILCAKEKETIRMKLALETEAHMMFPGYRHWNSPSVGRSDNFQESPQNLLVKTIW